MAALYPARAHALKVLENILALLPDADRAKPQLLFLQSKPVTYRDDTDRELPFRQESNFFYLSGCAVPASALLVSYLPAATSTTTSPTPTVSASGIQLPTSTAPAVDAANVLTTLFIPAADPLEVLWSPAPPSIDEAAAAHDASAVKHTSVLPHLLADLLGATPNAILHLLPHSQADPFPPLPNSVRALADSASVHASADFLLPALHLARLIKDAHEIGLIRRANAISSRAHELVMRLLGAYAGQKLVGRKAQGGQMPAEWRIEKEGDAEAVFVASCRREDATHQAYLPIVAASTRAATLHYCCNDKAFAWGPLPKANGHAHGSLRVHQHTQGNGHAHAGEGGGEAGGESYLTAQVLLIDAGCEWSNYASDITRVTPLGNGGRFTKEAREIYEVVLQMQNEAIASLRPGLHWDSVQYQCHATLVRQFLTLGIFTHPGHPSAPAAAEADILKSGISAAFFPHGVGHSLGLDVHDVPSASRPGGFEPGGKGGRAEHEAFYTYLRLRLPLQAGMVLTVEPGIYFSPHQLAPVRQSPYIDHAVLARYEHVGGVRIEDVLLITQGGCENLTLARKEVGDVEGLASGSL